MAQTSNTSPGMQASADKFVEIDGRIDARAKTLRERVANMPWGGSAGPAFKSTMDAWNLEFAKIQFHMDEMAELLRGQAIEILSTEDEARLQAAGFFNNT